MSFSIMSKRLGTIFSQEITRPANGAVVVRSYANNKNSLNRRELAAIIAEEHELSLAQSERIVKSVFDTIVEV